MEQWDEADAWFDRAAGFGTEARMEFLRALLRLRKDDVQGYRDVCAAMLGQFGGISDATTTNLVAWTCSLSPASGIDPDQLVRLAELAVNSRRSNANLNTLGLALLRAGRHQDAEAILAAAIEARDNVGTASDWVVLAMVHHGMGHKDEARHWFDKAARWINNAREQQASGGRVNPPVTRDFEIEVQVLLREAAALLSIERPFG
jgi:tetratricopeptide (TPR) repeat protein